ncbi:MAG: hypothetical protein ABI746_02440 [Dermatophilaceae bacterium]
MNSGSQAASGGIGGFLAFFVLACALWLLMRNMNSRLRSVKYREELEQERQASESGQDDARQPSRSGETPVDPGTHQRPPNHESLDDTDRSHLTRG